MIGKKWALAAIIVTLLYTTGVLAGTALDDLVSDLYAADWQIRRDAVIALGELGESDGLNYIEMALEDMDLNVRWAAVEALIQVGQPGVSLLIETTDHPEAKMREWAIAGLGKIGPDAYSAVPCLIGFLETGNPLQLVAIKALGQIGPMAKEAIGPLALLLAEDFRLGVAARSALSQIDAHIDITRVLLNLLAQSDEGTIHRVVGALSSLGPQASSALPSLILMAKDEDAALRQAAAKALGALGVTAENTVDPLISLLSDSEIHVRLAAVEALGQIKVATNKVATALSTMLFQNNLEIKRATLRGLKSLGTNSFSQAPLVALLVADQDQVIQRMAWDTLGYIAPNMGVPDLVANLAMGDDPELRTKAISALGFAETNEDKAVEQLVNALEDSDVDARSAAALALGNLGEHSIPAVPALTKVAQEPEIQVSWAALIGLGGIAPEVVSGLIESLGPRHVPALIEAAAGEDSQLRKAAIAILIESAEEIDLIEMMIGALSEGEVQMRTRAIKVLQGIGSEISEAANALILAVEDSNAEVAKLAQATLLELTGAPDMAAVIVSALSSEDPRVREAAQGIAKDYPPLYAVMEHGSMIMEIGQPAVVLMGDKLPLVNVSCLQAGTFQASIILNGEDLVEVVDLPLQAGAKKVIEISSPTNVGGNYAVQLKYIPSTREVESYYDAFYFTVCDPNTIPTNSSKTAFLNPEGRLVYVSDFKGNRLPDFSGVGYMGGGVSLPNAPVKIEIEPGLGDDTERIQAAIDYVSQLEPDEDGIRGAVLLRAGVYKVGGILQINTGGVVLRGQGQGDKQRLLYDPSRDQTVDELAAYLKDEKKTILIATGTAVHKILQIGGSSGKIIDMLSETKIIDDYVPVGARSFHVQHPERFAVGDRIIVRRYGNSQWISALGMDRIPPRSDGGTVNQWSPFNLDFEHVILGINGNEITIDSCIVNAIETKWGGGSIMHYTDNRRINQVGVEDLRAISYWHPDNLGKDNTLHADTFLDLYNITDSWVKNVTVEHFYTHDGAFRMGRETARVTVQDSSSLMADDKYYTGYVGRYGFHIQGQSILVMRCFVLNSRHSYVFGSRVSGPNVFLDCTGSRPLATSEPHHRWSTAGLYDNVVDQIALMNRSNMGSGHGWAGANYVAWNTEGTLTAHQPPTAQNWAIGHVGRKDLGGNRGPDGFWDSLGQHVEPRSLYLAQLEERLGKHALNNIGY